MKKPSINSPLLLKIEWIVGIPKCEDKDYKKEKRIQDRKGLELMQNIYKEQEDKCYLCLTKTSAPRIHHRVPDGPNIEENLVLVCHLCHKWTHAIIHRIGGWRRII